MPSMFEEDPGRLEKSLWYLHWSFAAGAVMDVFRENQRRHDQQGGMKASSDEWGWSEECRSQVWNRSRAFWRDRTDCQDRHFPFTVDQIVRLYMRYRKRNEDEIQAFEQEIARQTPPKGARPE